MTRGTRTTALALAGAVALASGAYALGSQAGDGSAAAAKSGAQNPPAYGPGPGYGFGGPPPGRRFVRPGLDRLATRLGVSEEALRNALKDIRPKPTAVRANIAHELADALGIDVANVQAAFDKLRPRKREVHRRDFAAALAKQLGLTTTKVEQALQAQRDHRGGPAALAKALGVTPQKLRQAFVQLWKDHGPPGARLRHRDHGPATAALAKELGVTQAQLQAAFEKVRAAHEADFAKLRDDLAQKLADRLHIDVAKVKAALDEFRPPFERKHP
jgi:lambda repressor-like predicted transcriptional regulator